MRRFRALLAHSWTGPLIRYGLAGGTVALVYLALPLLFNGVLGVPIQAAIPVAYAIAITLHFNLQRHFVFRHVDDFALSSRQQVGRYAVIAAIQYPTTAVATALLPGWLGLSERVVFVLVTLAVSAIFFVLLRVHVFHGDPAAELAVEAQELLKSEEHADAVDLVS